MDNQAKYEALKGEFEAESGFLVRPDQPARIKSIRVFKGEGGTVRIDIAPFEGDEEQVQLIVGREQLMNLLADPQDTT